MLEKRGYDELSQTCATNDMCTDVDGFFADALLVWICKARHSQKEIFEVMPDACPWLQEIVDYAERKGDAPVSFSSSLAVHAMLTGIRCVSGDGDIERVGSASNCALTTFCDQVKASTVASKYRLWGMMDSLEVLADPLPDKIHALANWNPLVAGTLILNLTFQNNMRIGTGMLNTNAMLTLHLYNALIQRNVLHDEIPFLADVRRILKQSKALWGGRVPTEGLFVKDFFVAVGIPLSGSASAAETIREMQCVLLEPGLENTSEDERNYISSVDLHSKYSQKLMGDLLGPWNRGKRKQTRRFLPSEISAGYRFFVDRDFSDAVFEKSVFDDSCKLCKKRLKSTIFATGRVQLWKKSITKVAFFP
jgi:hypothetical protein